MNECSRHTFAGLVRLDQGAGARPVILGLAIHTFRPASLRNRLPVLRFASRNWRKILKFAPIWPNGWSKQYQQRGIWTGLAIARLLYLLDCVDDANSIDRRGFAAYTPLQFSNRSTTFKGAFR